MLSAELIIVEKLVTSWGGYIANQSSQPTNHQPLSEKVVFSSIQQCNKGYFLWPENKDYSVLIWISYQIFTHLEIKQAYNELN